MNRESYRVGEALGWHVIACDGDMTARVHGGMCLGQTASGDLSFEPAQAVIALAPEGDQLKLAVVRMEQELLVPGQYPARAVLISPQTHVSVTFNHHTLDIDNDFAQGRPARGTLHIEVIDAGSTVSAVAREVRGPAGAGRRLGHDGDASNRTIVVTSAAAPSSAAGDQPRSSGWFGIRRPLLLGSGLIASVAALLLAAVYLPSRLIDPSAWTSTQTTPTAASGNDPAAPVPLLPEPAPGSVGVDGVVGADGMGASAAETPAQLPMSDELLERLAALLNAEDLPDRDTVGSLVETLSSLRAAYPDDARVADALSELTQRLLAEARASYDAGNAFQAGRLMELAVTTGADRAAVDAALAEMNAPPAARAAPQSVSRQSVAPKVVEPVPAVEPKPALEQAKRAPTGATDAGPTGRQSSAATETARSVIPEQTPATARDVAPEPAVDPAGGSVEQNVSTTADEPALQEPVYLPFSDLTVIRRTPLSYPKGVARRRNGSVDVSFTVSASGEVSEVSAESDLEAAFIESARQTIASWRFAPVIVDGQPTPVQSAIRVTFRR